MPCGVGAAAATARGLRLAVAVAMNDTTQTKDGGIRVDLVAALVNAVVSVPDGLASAALAGGSRCAENATAGKESE